MVQFSDDVVQLIKLPIWDVVVGGSLVGLKDKNVYF